MPMILSVTLLFTAASAMAQSARPCSEYLSSTQASAIVGPAAEPKPPIGQHTRDEKLEWHMCDWRSPSSKLALNVSLQRWKSEAEMRASQLSEKELGPKVKIERIPKLGELGAVYLNKDLASLVVTGSKGSKTLSVTLEAPPNQIPSDSRQRLEKLAESLWSKL